jgi:hypothetical protein
MRQFRTYGSARGDARKGVPYRDPRYVTGNGERWRGFIVEQLALNTVDLHRETGDAVR